MTVSERKGLGDGEGKTSIERRFAVGRRWAAAAWNRHISYRLGRTGRVWKGGRSSHLIQGARQAVYS